MGILTEEELRKAFCDTNICEPLCEGWSGLERFAREVERLVEEKHLPFFDRYGVECAECGKLKPLSEIQYREARRLTCGACLALTKGGFQNE